VNGGENMKKRLGLCLTMLGFFLLLSGCSLSKEEEYSKVVDLALKANQELMAEYEWDEKYSAYEKEKSNIMVWEDENNYYVYFRKNVEDAYVRGDGYKIGKSNDKWSSAPADRAKIVEFIDDNVPPVYEENNVELVADNMNMR
jgi:hypothetical protein